MVSAVCCKIFQGACLRVARLLAGLSRESIQKRFCNFYSNPLKVFKDKTFKEAELLGKRIERIYQFLLENTENGLNEKGTTTSEVADQLMIQRSNASKDLNQLVKEGRVQKE